MSATAHNIYPTQLQGVQCHCSWEQISVSCISITRHATARIVTHLELQTTHIPSNCKGYNATTTRGEMCGPCRVVLGCACGGDVALCFIFCLFVDLPENNILRPSIFEKNVASCMPTIRHAIARILTRLQLRTKHIPRNWKGHTTRLWLGRGRPFTWPPLDMQLHTIHIRRSCKGYNTTIGCRVVCHVELLAGHADCVYCIYIYMEHNNQLVHA